MNNNASEAVSHRFPAALLKAEPHERITWFDNRAVNHRTLDVTRTHLRRLLRSGRRYPIILLVGPTGIGKSTLLTIVKNEIIRELLPTLASDPGRIPVASVDAFPPEGGSFNWKDHYINCLAALREVLIMHKLSEGDCELCRDKLRLNDNPRVSAPSFRHALVHALIHRKPVAFFVDEAQHFMKMTSGRGVLDQMDVIKAIANATRIPHVLFGTYDLLSMRDLNGQLSRRNFEVHFGRYRYDVPADLLEFRKVLRSFELLIPLPEKPDLEQHCDFLYERSLGCVGTLKEWLLRAFELALEESSSRLTLEQLRATAKSVASCEKIADEIAYGESRLAEKPGKRTRLLSLLGMNPSTGQQSVQSAKVESTGPTNQPLPKKRRAIEQKPKRHPTERRTRAA